MICFGNVTLRNPVIIGSGPLTDKFSKVAAAAAAGAAAVSLKLTFVKVPFPSQMRSFSRPDDVILSPINRRLDLAEGVELMRRVKGELDICAMANFSAFGSAVDEWELLTERFLDAGTDILEPNFCCPNLNTSDLRNHVEHDHGGVSIADHPEVCGQLVGLMRRMTDRPIIPKIMPSTRSLLLRTCKAVRQSGADGIHVVGHPATGLPPVLPDGTPDLPFLDDVAPGSTNGPLCRYSTYLMIAQVAQALDIPIIASGGLTTGRDAVDAVMWGATAVAVCSAVMWHGWEVVGAILDGLNGFLADQELASLESIRGRALQHLTTPDKVRLVPGHAVVDEAPCSGCGRCLKPGHCEPISMTPAGKACVNPDVCIACGVCRALCPVQAIMYPTDG
jgi:dihydroorotate dehydrogenase/Pyruvate/2-oxoacid:ferredoxin oxidoreductase delta subunit